MLEHDEAKVDDCPSLKHSKELSTNLQSEIATLPMRTCTFTTLELLRLYSNRKVLGNLSSSVTLLAIHKLH